MVAGKVKTSTMVQQKPPNKTSSSPAQAKHHHHHHHQQQNAAAPFTRSFGVYFPRASAQVQPTTTHPHHDAEELLRVVEQLRESESRLKTEVVELKLLKESAVILENVISSKDKEIQRFRDKIGCLEEENEMLRDENERLHDVLRVQSDKYEEMIRSMQSELQDIKRAVEEQQERDEESSSSSSSSPTTSPSRECDRTDAVTDGGGNNKSCDVVLVVSEAKGNHCAIDELRSRVTPRVPAPPPKPSAFLLAPLSTSSSPVSNSSSCGSLFESSDNNATALESSKVTPKSSPPPAKVIVAPPPPPPPPPPPKGSRAAAAKVRRVPEVVEFYHALMRRDSNFRRDSGGGGGGGAADGIAATKDMIGEIANRSAHLLAIKTDVETQGDLIRFLIKEVEDASFADIEDVLTFVKWLDHELSFLVDERAVLKHFDWPEKKADALREAAFGYRDLKKLESEASSDRDDPRQPCSHALKKMQSLFEKLEHGVYNLSRIRESSAKRFEGFHIPTNWMLETGYASKIKLASVKLAMKYMKRISAELENVGGGQEEEDLIVHGVKFAFRVHQFAGGFDVETMRAFQELRDKARSCNNAQAQSKFVHKSSSAAAC